MSDLASSQNPISQHLLRDFLDLSLKAPCPSPSLPLCSTTRRGRAEPVNSFACLAFWLLSHEEVAGQWTFSCSFYFKPLEMLPKENKNCPAFWQTERTEEKSKHLGHPASFGVGGNNSSSVPSWGLLPAGTQTQQGLPLGNPYLVCFFQLPSFLGAEAREGRRQAFPLPKGSMGKIRKESGKVLGQYNQSLPFPNPVLPPNPPTSSPLLRSRSHLLYLNPRHQKALRGDKT